MQTDGDNDNDFDFNASETVHGQSVRGSMSGGGFNTAGAFPNRDNIPGAGNNLFV